MCGCMRIDDISWWQMATHFLQSLLKKALFLVLYSGGTIMATFRLVIGFDIEIMMFWHRMWLYKNKIIGSQPPKHITLANYHELLAGVWFLFVSWNVVESCFNCTGKSWKVLELLSCLTVWAYCYSSSHALITWPLASEQTLFICHTTICRNPINFLYNSGHMTLWCVEVGPVANARKGSIQEHDQARVQLQYHTWM